MNECTTDKSILTTKQPVDTVEGSNIISLNMVFTLRYSSLSR